MLMQGLNMVILAGNLGADPEYRVVGNGDAVMRLRLATSESYKNKDGEWVETTEWHTVNLWGRQAEFLRDKLSKGSEVVVHGKLTSRSYADRDGRDKWVTEIKAQRVIVAGAQRQGGGGERRQTGRTRDVPTEYDLPPDTDDGIPF